MTGVVQFPLSTHERGVLLIHYDKGVTMTAKRILVSLSVLIIVVSVPILTHASGENYGRIWVAYPEQPPIWNVFEGGTPIEWMAWANNARFSTFNVVWRGNPNIMDIVLDHSTGLVWQRRPLNTSGTCAQAQLACTTAMMGTGYFMGWRLPQVQELASLVDYSYGGNVLPYNHPFIIGDGFKFWSASPDPTTPGYGLYVDFFNYNSPVQSAPKSAVLNIWCVRGGAPPGGC
jgi:hypothetical protein